MTVDYRIILIVFILAVLLIIFFIRRNNKDREDFEDQLNERDLPPDSHRDKEI